MPFTELELQEMPVPYIKYPDRPSVKIEGALHPTKEKLLTIMPHIETEEKVETDPNGKQPHEMGAKLDAGKAPISQGVLQYFPRALQEVSMVSLVGAKKYAWKGWEAVSDGVNRYSDALGRHLLAEAIEGEIDSDTGMLHAAQIAWNALARLELMKRKKEQEKINAKINGSTNENKDRSSS